MVFGIKETIITVVAVIFASVGLANMEAIQAQWADWNQPSAHTELYFDKSVPLPGEYVPGETQTFSFSFLNQEQQDVAYSFELIATGEDTKPKVIGKGGAQSQSGQIGTVNPSFALPDMGGEVLMQVVLDYELPSGKQQKTISFPLDRAEGPSDVTARP